MKLSVNRNTSNWETKKKKHTGFLPKQNSPGDYNQVLTLQSQRVGLCSLTSTATFVSRVQLFSSQLLLVPESALQGSYVCKLQNRNAEGKKLREAEWKYTA